MKALLIGGTGVISTSVVLRLLEQKWDVTILTRGKRQLPDAMLGKVRQIVADIHDEVGVMQALEGLYFDVICDFVLYTPQEAERDIRLFSDKTAQYVFISTASAYHKPVLSLPITEKTPLHNPYWSYSDLKAQCEGVFRQAFMSQGFPVTIVRPSHTYCERSVPIGVHGNGGAWQVVKRMIEGKPVIIHGDGTSLWTLTHADDFAKGFVGLMGNVHAIGQAYQITSDESLTWTQIHKIIADTLGVEFKPYYVPSDFLAAVSNYDFEGGLIGDKANSVIFDNSKLKRAVPDYCATIRFDQGAKQALDYMLTHPECQTPDPEFDEWCDRVIDALENAKKEILK